MKSLQGQICTTLNGTWRITTCRLQHILPTPPGPPTMEIPCCAKNSTTLSSPQAFLLKSVLCCIAQRNRSSQFSLQALYVFLDAHRHIHTQRQRQRHRNTRKYNIYMLTNLLGSSFLKQFVITIARLSRIKATAAKTITHQINLSCRNTQKSAIPAFLVVIFAES